MAVNRELKVIYMNESEKKLLKKSADNIIGSVEFIMDITECVLYENRLKEQSHTIREMSTPTIKLWEGVLVLPVVGVVDSLRAQHMMESMLNEIAETYSKVIILDIHGVAAVDMAVANRLIKIAKATKLMGCECMVRNIPGSRSDYHTVGHIERTKNYVRILAEKLSTYE